jgi:sugar lactone lactonase YvrE
LWQNIVVQINSAPFFHPFNATIMKKHILPMAALLLGIASCTKNESAEIFSSSSEPAAALKPSGTLPSSITLAEPDLFPEGVVYDKFTSRFYVSSVSRGDVGTVNAAGNYEVFIDDPALIATTGLEIDAARKLLYVANSPGSVGIYTLTGERIRMVDLASLTPGLPVFINDIALDAQGDAYVTNSFGSIIYKISTDGTASIFFRDPGFAPAPGQFGFNGIEYGTDHGGYLLVAYSAANQIIKIPIGDTDAASVVSLNASLAGPDGLLLSKDGKQLIVVNNAGGGEGKVLSFTTTDSWQSGTLGSSFSTGAVFPTTATSDGKDVFVLYAYLNRRAVGQSMFTIRKVPISMAHPF